MKVEVKTMPLGETTAQGRYWPQVNGVNVGCDGRSHFDTKREALECGCEFAKKELSSSDCSKDPSECPNNEGYGCDCS